MHTCGTSERAGRGGLFVGKSRCLTFGAFCRGVGEGLSGLHSCRRCGGHHTMVRTVCCINVSSNEGDSAHSLCASDMAGCSLLCAHTPGPLQAVMQSSGSTRLLSKVHLWDCLGWTERQSTCQVCTWHLISSCTAIVVPLGSRLVSSPVYDWLIRLKRRSVLLPSVLHSCAAVWLSQRHDRLMTCTQAVQLFPAFVCPALCDGM